MPEVLNVPLFLDIIRTNDKYREDFIAAAPDTKADVISFYDNPNCNCRRKIVDYVDKNRDSQPVKDFFAKWKPQIANLFIDVNPNLGAVVKPTNNGVMTVEAVNESAPKSTTTPVKLMAGHVVEIPAEPNEYKNLLEHGSKDKWVYRGLTVLPKDDKWLVFFY